MVSQELKDKLWAKRWKKFPKRKFKANPIGAKLDRLTQSVMAEIMDGNPGKAIQATMDLASYMKTIGMQRGSFLAIMQNLDLMSQQHGRKPGELRRWIRNKEFYLGKSKIIRL